MEQEQLKRLEELDWFKNLPKFNEGDLVQILIPKKYPLKLGEKMEYVLQSPKFEYVGLDESNPIHCMLKILEDGTWLAPHHKVGDVVSFHRQSVQLAEEK